MTQQPQRPTATIHQFPRRARATSDSHRQTVKPAQQQAATQFAATEFGRGWYHQAAIEEAEEACDLGHQQH